MWNDHGIHTERGPTHNQLFTVGILLRLRNSGRNAILTFLVMLVMTPSEDSEGTGVAVPAVSVPHTSQQLDELQLTVNPLSECNYHGISMYLQTLEIVRSWSR